MFALLSAATMCDYALLSFTSSITIEKLVLIEINESYIFHLRFYQYVCASFHLFIIFESFAHFLWYIIRGHVNFIIICNFYNSLIHICRVALNGASVPHEFVDHSVYHNTFFFCFVFFFLLFCALTITSDIIRFDRLIYGNTVESIQHIHFIWRIKTKMKSTNRNEREKRKPEVLA